MSVLALLFACGSCGQPTNPGSLVDRDSDGYTADIDCDDQNPNVNPAAEELCDELDNDCDSFIDEPGAIGAVEWFADVDQDGYGDASSSQTTCTQPEDYIADNRDCDDLDPFIYPNAPEYCDGVDNDCDELTDEDSALDSTVFYRDVDGDGFGNPFISDRRCFAGNGYVDNDTDCNDSDPLIHPNGAEICDEVDNDCDLLVDDQDADVQDALSWYADIDGDGYGSGAATLACEPPFFFMVADATDCNDQEAAISPAAIEWCGDGIDNDCDLLVDVDDSDAVAVQWYTDNDGDGYGSAEAGLGFSCEAIPGGSALVDDCDDTDPLISPSTPEVWYDGIDQDCAGGDDFDADLDGVPLAEDCDDGNADIRPGIPDTCGSQVDENCDSVVDICQLSGQVLDGLNVGDESGTALLAGPITDDFSDESFWVAGPGDDQSAVGAGSVMLLPFAGPDFAQPTINIVGESLADHIGTQLITTEFGLASGQSAAPELWISSYGSDLNGHNAGGVYWLSSDPAELLALSTDGVTVLLSAVPDRLLGNAAGDYFGWSIASHDAGEPQVLIGAPMASTGSLGLIENGTAYLFSDTDLIGGTQLAQTAPHQFIGINSGDQSATTVGLGDVNGDGLSDAIIGSPYHSQGQYEGLVTIDLAPFGQLNLLADAEGQWRGDLPNSNIGTSLAVGDVNADGFDDVVIGAPYRDGDNGAVYIVYGPGTGSNSVAQANISLLPHENHTLLGSKVWVVDLDQDGALDVAASAPNADTQLPRTGAVLGIHGPLGAAENFDWVLYSSNTGDHLADSLLPTDSGFVLGSARRAAGNGGLMWVEWSP